MLHRCTVNRDITETVANSVKEQETKKLGQFSYFLYLDKLEFKVYPWMMTEQTRRQIN